MSYRVGLWIFHNGLSACYVTDDLYTGDYEFSGMNGWVKKKVNYDLGFSDAWDKVSANEALSMIRKRKGWTSELEKKFLDFPKTVSSDEAPKEMKESVSKTTFSKFSDRVKEALRVASDAHEGQRDRSGKPYIYHPMTVASKVAPDESAMVVALLHDVVEDTPIRFSDLRYLLNSDEMKALRLLTRSRDMDYMEYVKRIKGNALATKVKLADLSHNSDASRLRSLTDTDKERLEKYRRAMEILRSG